MNSKIEYVNQLCKLLPFDPIKLIIVELDEAKLDELHEKILFTMCPSKQAPKSEQLGIVDVNAS